MGRPVRTLRSYHPFQWSKDQTSTLENYMTTSADFIQFTLDVKAKGTKVSESRLKDFQLSPELLRDLGLELCNNEELRNDLGEKIRDIVGAKVKRRIVRSWAKLEESSDKKSVSLSPAEAAATTGSSTVNSKPTRLSPSVIISPRQGSDIQSIQEVFQDKLSSAPSPIRSTWCLNPSSTTLGHTPTSALPPLVENTGEETTGRIENNLPPLSSRLATLNFDKITQANINPRPLRRSTSVSLSRSPIGPPPLPSHVSPINPSIEPRNSASSPNVLSTYTQSHYDKNQSSYDDDYNHNQTNRSDGNQYNQFDEIDQLFRPAPGLKSIDGEGLVESTTRKSGCLPEEDLISADKRSELLAVATEVEVQQNKLIHIEGVLLRKLNDLRHK